MKHETTIEVAAVLLLVLSFMIPAALVGFGCAPCLFAAVCLWSSPLWFFLAFVPVFCD